MSGAAGLSSILACIVLTAGVHAAPPTGATDSVRPEVLDTFLKMRIAATALDTHRVIAPYPGPTSGIVPLSSIVEEISPGATAIGGSARDGWGNPLLYWSNGRAYLVLSLGSDGKAQFDYDAEPPYALVSFGADGLPEFPYSTWGRAEFEGFRSGPTFDAGRDIVFAEGRFAQWPAIGSGP